MKNIENITGYPARKDYERTKPITVDGSDGAGRASIPSTSDVCDFSQRPPGSLNLLTQAEATVRSVSEGLKRTLDSRNSPANLPITVKDAARFLGVSPQTVYLWVERKQIPHFRVMGRNIRFLISDLRPFRAQFKQEVENGKTA